MCGVCLVSPNQVPGADDYFLHHENFRTAWRRYIRPEDASSVTGVGTTTVLLTSSPSIHLDQASKPSAIHSVMTRRSRASQASPATPQGKSNLDKPKQSGFGEGTVTSRALPWQLGWPVLTNGVCCGPQVLTSSSFSSETSGQWEAVSVAGFNSEKHLEDTLAKFLRNNDPAAPSVLILQ
jgi:hypothetical protein